MKFLKSEAEVANTDMEIEHTHQRTGPHPLELVREPYLMEAVCNPLCLLSWKSQVDSALGGQSPRCCVGPGSFRPCLASPTIA